MPPLALALALALPLAASAPAPTPGEGFAGRWMTSFGPLELTLEKGRARGSYGWDGESHLEGKLARKRLEFEWRGPGRSGSGWFELWKDGDTFTGEYTLGAGQPPEFWGGYRLAPERAARRPGQVTTGQSESGLEYHLRLPADFDGSRRYTAVALFHGSNANARDYVEGFPGNWPALGERYILVGFNGEHLSPASRAGARAFNASYVEFSGEGVGEPWRHNQTPALVARALAQLERELPIERWFASGHSQGGFLTLALAMFYPERLAAAVEVAGNLLVQCEPGAFTDDALRAAQRRLPIALVHGQKDRVVEFSAATYTLEALQDGGFPLLRLFAPRKLGHMWAYLPLDEALLWCEELTQHDPLALLDSAERALGEQRWRDATGALTRAEEALRAAPEEARTARRAALSARIEAAAAPEAARLLQAIEAGADDAWVDAFWQFRADFAFSAAAAPVLAAYQRLRQQHEQPAAERFWRARGLTDEAEKQALYREIVTLYYASSFYRLVKGWLE